MNPWPNTTRTPLFSMLIEFDPEHPEECWLWCIRQGDASHYKVMIDGHCDFFALPSVVSYLSHVIMADLPYGEHAPDAECY